MVKKRGPSLRSALKKGYIPSERPMESMSIGEWRVEFIREVHPRNFMKTPLIILGGLLPHLESFRQEVMEIAQSRPVYIVNLPGLGSNTQAAAELGHKEMAELLRNFLDSLGLEKIVPVGHMGSAPIAYYFSTMYPDAVEKVVLNGASVKLRPSVKLVLKDVLRALNNQDLEQFATRMVMGFMNYSMREKVRHSEDISTQLHEYFLNMDEEECERYRVTLHRLLEQDKWGSGPRCPTLVMVGEYDNFTTAYDGYRVVSDCLRGNLAVVKSGDHLVTQQKGNQVLKAIQQFMENEELDQVRGVNVWKKNDFPIAKRRLSPRHEVEQEANLKTSEGDSHPVVIREISSQGCHVELTGPQQKMAEEQLLNLEIPELDFEVELLVFDASQTENGLGFRGLFKANSFEKAKETEEAIRQLVEKKKFSVSA